MTTIALRQETGARMLGTRPAARDLAPALRQAACDGVILLDTSDVLRVGVSFFDESLLILDEIIRETGDADLRLVYHQAPPTESLKNLVAHRGFVLHESDDGDWIISRQSDGNADDAR